MSDALDDYKASWLRILLSIVGNDQNAHRGMELAELHGLFDPIAALRSQGGSSDLRQAVAKMREIADFNHDNRFGRLALEAMADIGASFSREESRG